MSAPDGRGPDAAATCPACARPLTDGARFCPTCGELVPGVDMRGAEVPRWRRYAVPLLAAAAVLTVAGLGALLLVRGPDALLPTAAPTPEPTPDPAISTWWSVTGAGNPARPLVTQLVPTDHGLVAASDTVLWLIGTEGEIVWERRLPTGIADGPVATGEVVAVRHGGELTGVDVVTGTTRWSASVDGETALTGSPHAVLAHDVDDARLAALDARSGARRWDVPFRGEVTDADDRLVLAIAEGDDERRLLALDLASGEERWSVPVAGAAPAVRAAAVIADDAIVVVGDGQGELSGLDRASGELRWTAPVTRRGDVVEITAGGLVVVQERSRSYVALDVRTGQVAWFNDHLVIGPEELEVGRTTAISVTADNQLTAVSLADGVTLWSVRRPPAGQVAVTGDLAVLTDGEGQVTGVDPASRASRWSTWLPPAGRGGIAADGDVVVRTTATRSTVTAHEGDSGTVRWSRRLPSPSLTQPSVDGGLVVVRRAVDRPDDAFPDGIAVTAFDARDGATLWEVPGSGAERPRWPPALHPASVAWLGQTAPTVTGDTVVEAAGRQVRALEATDGELRWEAELAGDVRAPATITGDLVLVGDLSGEVTALDRAHGHVRWRFTADGPISTSPDVADGRVMVGTDEGAVHLLDTEGEERWRRHLDAPVRFEPVAVGDVIVAVGSEIVALDRDDGTTRWTLPHGMILSGPPTAGHGGLHLGHVHGGVVTVEPTSGDIVTQLVLPAAIGHGPAGGDGLTFVMTVTGEIHAIGPRAGGDVDWPLPPIGGRW